jgi:hypothetical protein
VTATHEFQSETSNLNTRVVEKWINQTMLDAENMSIPSIVLKPEHKDPINRYGISRNILTNAGVSNKGVDRVYRSLFVHSVGFYDMLKTDLSNVNLKDRSLLEKSIWKVYIILLEYCCRSDYLFTVEKV